LRIIAKDFNLFNDCTSGVAWENPLAKISNIVRSMSFSRKLELLGVIERGFPALLDPLNPPLNLRCGWREHVGRILMMNKTRMRQ
jgi:hypothetical protein